MSRLIPSTSASGLRPRAPRRATIRVNRSSLLSGVELRTCPLCGQDPADDRILLNLRWSTGVRYDDGKRSKDDRMEVNVRVPTCRACRVDHEREQRAVSRRALDLTSGGLAALATVVWIGSEGALWAINVAAIGLSLALPVVGRWWLRRTATGRALEVAQVRGNVVELEGPESVRQVLAEEYPAALNVDGA